jgi:voltage-gated potassium channel
MGLKKIELRDHFIICGYNLNLPGIIQALLDSSERSGCRIVLINNHPESRFSDLAERFPHDGLQFVYGDYTNEATLLRAGIRNAHSVIIVADSGAESGQKPDDRTLLAILAIKSVSKDIPVSAEVLDSTNLPHLVRAGVDQTVVAGEFSGFFLANAVISPGVPQALREIMNVRNGCDIRRCPFPREYIGKSFRDAAIGFLEQDGSVLIGVITEQKSFNLDSILQGESGAIDAFIRRKFAEVGRSLEIETRGRLSVRVNPGKAYTISEFDTAVVLTEKHQEV